MKVRFVNRFFHPDLSATSRVLSQIAFNLARQGDEVSVVCSRVRYEGGEAELLPSRENMNGVSVRRSWGPSLGRSTLAGRGLDLFFFCLLASAHLLTSSRSDVVVFLTDPPFLPVLGTLLKRFRGERIVCHLMDMYPEVAVRAGVLREGAPAERILRRISRASLRGADKVLVLGDDMREAAIRSGAAPQKVVVIRNWADEDAIFPVLHGENRLRMEWGLDGKFVVEYSGNFGVSHDFEDILWAAEALAGFDDIRFLFIGGGVRRKEVEQRIASGRTTNAILLPYQPASALSHSLSAGDVHYVSLREGFEGLVVPSKAYGIMAAGRPIIYQGSAEGEIARMVTREKIGVVLSPGAREGLKERILEFYRDREAVARMGDLARRTLVEKYGAAAGLSRCREALREVLRKDS
jgi:glycosyltransferase involved in cell wall biosynthesis